MPSAALFLRLFPSLLLIGAGESFSPPFDRTPTSKCGNGDCIAPWRLHARPSDDGRRGRPRRPRTRGNDDDATPRRVPRNKRTAIRWVVQGVERCLSEEGGGSALTAGSVGRERSRGSNPERSYRRRIDASLVDALYIMVDAGSRGDILDAERRLQELTRDPGKFPTEATERVIRATAMAGLSSLSRDLLRSLLRGGSGRAADALPSPMAYTAVLDALRRSGRTDALEGMLAGLADEGRRIARRTGRKARTGIDVVAFNVHLAALCDAAASGQPFNDENNRFVDDDDDDVANFNFTSLTSDSSGGADATTTTSPSEKYLYKALNLLKGDVARRRFALNADPDRYSYNSVLNAAAKCSESFDDDENDRYTDFVVSSCLQGMEERGIEPDVVTYNARIRAALAAPDGDGAAIRLADEIASDPGLEPDRYTVDFLLAPLLRAGRRGDALSALRRFYDGDAGGRPGDGGVVSSAFESFLNTIVQRTGDVDFADEVFRSFFVPPARPAAEKKTRTMEVSQAIRVMDADGRLLQRRDEMDQDSGEATPDTTSSTPDTTSRRPVERRNRPPPRTRHFNILFSGYSKAHLSAISRPGKPRTLDSDLLEDLKDMTNITTSDNVNGSTNPNAQKAYDLLDTMISIGVPLDGFSVTPLMALPSTPETITSLLKRIEPEMMVHLNPAAYRSIISAYGKVGDPSSASWMFEEMIQSRENRGGRNAENWNVLLGALSKACVAVDCAANKNNNGGNSALDILNSSAARSRSRKNLPSHTGDEGPADLVISRVDGKSCLDASMAILDIMRDGTLLPEGHKIPKPNSQSYCLVASALSGYGTSEPAPDRALSLFRGAMGEGVAADGRFLNAVLRCFGDDVEGALAAWKSDVGPAAAARERRARGGKGSARPGTDLIAAYNGLMHVCGRAVRPDAATRIAYAMNKAGLEPTEATLNSYFAGKRVALGDDEGDASQNTGLRDQYETLLSVECTKYNTNDKRQAKDKKIRIILSN